MQPAMLLMLQALTGTSVDHFDLRNVPPAQCGQSGSAIVVCGHRRSYRLKDMPQDNNEEHFVPRAEVRVFGRGTAALHAENHEMQQGVVSHRAMVTLTLPF